MFYKKRLHYFSRLSTAITNCFLRGNNNAVVKATNPMLLREFYRLSTAITLTRIYEEVERKKAEKKRKQERERALQRATLQLQGRFGKNAVLRGMNLMEGGTTIERNGQIGGHRAEASEVKKDGKRDKKQ